MFSFGAVQGILGPLTPLGQDTIRAVFIGAGKIFGFQLQPDSQEVLYAAGERLWINLTELIRNRVGRRLTQGAAPMLEPSIAQALDTLWADPRLAVTGGLRPGAARRIARALVPILPRFIRSLLRPDAERERFLARDRGPRRRVRGAHGRGRHPGRAAGRRRSAYRPGLSLSAARVPRPALRRRWGRSPC